MATPTSIGFLGLGQMGPAARGIACVDSPVSGGPASARAGNLTLLAAGAPRRPSPP